MAKVKKLSLQSAEKLAEAADYFAEKVATGEDKVTAFIQTAKQFSLSPEQVHILLRGWNISNVLNKFASSKDAFSRLDYEDAVYITDVLKFLQNEEKEAKSDQIVDLMYYTVPEFPKRAVLKRDKFLELKDPSVREHEKVAQRVYFDKKVDELTFTVKRLVDELELLKTDYAIKQAKLVNAIDASRLDIRFVKENLSAVSSDYVKEIEKIEDRLIKYANIDKTFSQFSAEHPVYKLCLECAKTAKLIKQSGLFLNFLKLKLQGISKLAKRFQNNIVEETDFRPFFASHDGKHKGFGGYFSKLENLENLENKEAAGQVGFPDQGKQKKQQPQRMPRESKRDKGEKEIRIIDVERQSRAEQRAAEEKKKVTELLQQPAIVLPLDILRGISNVTKLYLEDKVLSKYSPHEVYEAYNALSALVPKVMLNESLARLLLQKYLAQGGVLDVFDIEKLMKIEKPPKYTYGE